jgi:hypothetical protein
MLQPAVLSPLGWLFLVSFFPKIAWTRVARHTRLPPPRVIIWHWWAPRFLAAKTHSAPPHGHRNPRGISFLQALSRRWVAAQKQVSPTQDLQFQNPPGDQK